MSGTTEQDFETAMTNHLRAADQLSGDEFVTHYALVYATVGMDGMDDLGILTSGPSDVQGIPGWQVRGLLKEGIRASLLQEADEEDDM